MFFKNSRRLWRFRRRNSRSVPEDGADIPAAIFLAENCPNLGRDSAGLFQQRQNCSRKKNPSSKEFQKATLSAFSGFLSFVGVSRFGVGFGPLFLLWGKLFYLQLELFRLQLSFFACSPLRPLLGALSHCKQKSSNCK